MIQKAFAQAANTARSTAKEVDSGIFGLDFETIGLTLLYKFIDLVEAVLIIMAGLFVLRLIRKYLYKMETIHEQQKVALDLIDKMVSGFIVIVSVTIALKVLGIDMTLLVSVMILGLSYGLQDVIKNYVAGIIIMFKSPFKVGDAVKVDKFLGKIIRIDFQSTQLKTWDNKMITIYNAKLLKKEITNYYKLPIRRMEMDFKFGYGTDFEKVKQAMLAICTQVPESLNKPVPKVVWKKHEPDGVVMQLRFWTKYPSDILTTRTKVANKVSKIYNDADVFMPFGKGIEMGDDHSLQARQSQSQKSQEDLSTAEPVEKQVVEGLSPQLVEAIENDYDAE
jgi:small-conductance mechanosensitive channel